MSSSNTTKPTSTQATPVRPGSVIKLADPVQQARAEKGLMAVGPPNKRRRIPTGDKAISKTTEKPTRARKTRARVANPVDIEMEDNSEGNSGTAEVSTDAPDKDNSEGIVDNGGPTGTGQETTEQDPTAREREERRLKKKADKVALMEATFTTLSLEDKPQVFSAGMDIAMVLGPERPLASEGGRLTLVKSEEVKGYRPLYNDNLDPIRYLKKKAAVEIITAPGFCPIFVKRVGGMPANKDTELAGFKAELGKVLGTTIKHIALNPSSPWSVFQIKKEDEETTSNLNDYDLAFLPKSSAAYVIRKVVASSLYRVAMVKSPRMPPPNPNTEKMIIAEAALKAGVSWKIVDLKPWKKGGADNAYRLTVRLNDINVTWPLDQGFGGHANFKAFKSIIPGATPKVIATYAEACSTCGANDHEKGLCPLRNWYQNNRSINFGYNNLEEEPTTATLKRKAHTIEDVKVDKPRKSKHKKPRLEPTEPTQPTTSNTHLRFVEEGADEEKQEEWGGIGQEVEAAEAEAETAMQL